MEITEDYIYFDKDFYEFWQYLGLKEDCTTDDVLQVSETLSDEQKRDPFIRFAWKLLKDPYFSEVYRQSRSIKVLYESGFFIDQYDDNNDLFFDLNFMTTPFAKLKDNLGNKSDLPYIVLLTTGGFSPVHKRHMETMELARKTVEERGYNVIGGYISPSHDNYVSRKYQGTAAMHIEKRIYLIEKVVADVDWLYVDRWEGLYNTKSINFTDVITRLEAYLNHHLPTKHGIKVCYVFGEDNAAFLNAFDKQGYAVCVDRQGYAHKSETILEKYIDHPRMFFVSDSEVEPTSSSDIRKGNMDLLPDQIQEDYLKFRDNIVDNNEWSIYAIRDDISVIKHRLARMISMCKYPNTLLYINTIIEDSFDDNMTVHRIEADTQCYSARKILKESPIKSLSLDVHVKGEYNFQISRLFDMASGQIHPIKLVNRPGSLSLNRQLAKIPAGEYTLVEDDIGSGTTLNKLFEVLPDYVKIVDKLILSRLDGFPKDIDFYDIVDMRDFIIGLPHSGLVVSLPNGKIVRAPYMLPYVSPSSRAKIPAGKELAFSLKVWEMNKFIFADNQYVLGDLDKSFVNLMKYIGFTDETPVLDIIDYHIRKL